MSLLARMFSQIDMGNVRFVILDCPTESSLPHYIKELELRGATDVVRVCESTYDQRTLLSHGIVLHDWPFKDGGVPSQKIIADFLALCQSRFGRMSIDAKNANSEGPCIAVHCVAGLGRAPVLVALALIEAGMAPMDTIEFIRKQRRGAFNSTQLQFLVDQYKRSRRSQGLSSVLSGSQQRRGHSRQDHSPSSSHSGSSVASPVMNRSSSAESSGSSLRDSISRIFRWKPRHPAVVA